MIPNKKPNSPFIPLSAAISDTFLQIRTKPLIFLAVWLLFPLLPLFLFYFPFQQLITEMTEIFYQVPGEMPGSGVMRNSNGAQSALLILMFRILAILTILASFAFYVYQYSVLADVIARFRKKLPLKITRNLSGGLRRFGSLLKVFLASWIRILIGPGIITILGIFLITMFGFPLEQEALIYVGFIVLIVGTSVLLFINLLCYRLAPYIHLSLGTGWRSSLAVSKSYYRAHLLRVLVLFGFAFFLPYVIFGLLNLVPLTRARSIVLGGLPAEKMITAIMGDPIRRAMSIALAVLQSTVMFFMGGVLINFSMNNFILKSSVEGGDDSREVEAPS